MFMRVSSTFITIFSTTWRSVEFLTRQIQVTSIYCIMCLFQELIDTSAFGREATYTIVYVQQEVVHLCNYTYLDFLEWGVLT